MLKRRLLPTIAAAALMAGGGYLTGRNTNAEKRTTLAGRNAKLQRERANLERENRQLEAKRSALQIFRLGEGMEDEEGSGNSSTESLGKLRLHFQQRAREHQQAASSLLHKRRLTQVDLENARTTGELMEELLPLLGHLHEDEIRRRLAQTRYQLLDMIERVPK